MILFTLVDLIFRKFEDEPSLPELNIEASGFSDMITVQILYSGTRKHGETMQECMQTMQQIESYYNGQVVMKVESHDYGCSVIITKISESTVNTIHPRAGALNTHE